MPTLATGNNRPHPSRGRPPHRGFTLIEMVASLAMAGLLAGLAAPAMLKAFDSMAYQGSVRDVITNLRAARNQAMATGRATDFVLTPEDKRFGIENRLTHALAKNITIDLIVSAEHRQPSRSVIRFYPDGSSTGGSILLKRENGGGMQIRVDWLLGRVTQHPLTASP